MLVLTPTLPRNNQGCGRHKFKLLSIQKKRILPYHKHVINEFLATCVSYITMIEVKLENSYPK